MSAHDKERGVSINRLILIFRCFGVGTAQDATCRFAYSLLFEVYERGLGDASKHQAEAVKVLYSSSSFPLALPSLRSPAQIANELAERIDPVRHKYWLWRRDNYSKPIGALPLQFATSAPATDSKSASAAAPAASASASAAAPSATGGAATPAAAAPASASTSAAAPAAAIAAPAK
jgi:hypothetical protein